MSKLARSTFKGSTCLFHYGTSSGIRTEPATLTSCAILSKVLRYARPCEFSTVATWWSACATPWIYTSVHHWRQRFEISKPKPTLGLPADNVMPSVAAPQAGSWRRLQACDATVRIRPCRTADGHSRSGTVGRVFISVQHRTKVQKKMRSARIAFVPATRRSRIVVCHERPGRVHGADKSQGRSPFRRAITLSTTLVPPLSVAQLVRLLGNKGIKDDHTSTWIRSRCRLRNFASVLLLTLSHRLPNRGIAKHARRIEANRSESN